MIFILDFAKSAKMPSCIYASTLKHIQAEAQLGNHTRIHRCIHACRQLYGRAIASRSVTQGRSGIKSGPDAKDNLITSVKCVITLEKQPKLSTHCFVLLVCFSHGASF